MKSIKIFYTSMMIACTSFAMEEHLQTKEEKIPPVPSNIECPYEKSLEKLPQSFIVENLDSDVMAYEFFKKKDYENAALWAKKGISQDLGYSMFLLGFMYQKGFGVPLSYDQAFLFHKKALAEGEVKSYMNICILFQEKKQKFSTHAITIKYLSDLFLWIHEKFKISDEKDSHTLFTMTEKEERDYKKSYFNTIKVLEKLELQDKNEPLQDNVEIHQNSPSKRNNTNERKDKQKKQKQVKMREDS